MSVKSMLVHEVKRLVEWPFRGPQLRAMRSRHAYERADFVKHFEVEGVEPAIAQAVWSALAAEAVIPGFKPMPDDDIGKILGLADEDLDDVGLALLKSCGCRIPTPDETAKMMPVRTVADLVHFVAASQKSSP